MKYYDAYNKIFKNTTFRINTIWIYELNILVISKYHDIILNSYSIIACICLIDYWENI